MKAGTDDGSMICNPCFQTCTIETVKQKQNNNISLVWSEQSGAPHECRLEREESPQKELSVTRDKILGLNKEHNIRECEMCAFIVY